MTAARVCAAVRRMGAGAVGRAVRQSGRSLPSTRREPISPRSVTSSINQALLVGTDTLNTTRAVEIVVFRMPMRERG
jgi:hypothetical protein